MNKTASMRLSSVIRSFLEARKDILYELDGKDWADNKIWEVCDKERKIKDHQHDVSHGWEVLKICVAGDFSTGKSTFINSLLGEELLGTDINPETAKVTALKYGPELRFYKAMIDSSDLIEISKEEFQVLSKKGDTSDSTDEIDHFELTLPNKLLKRIHLYDTPGFNTAQYSNIDEELTQRQIGKSDLVIWLSLSSNGGITRAEIERLRSLKVSLICIINQIDLIPPEDMDKILREYTKQVETLDTKPQVFLYASKPILEYELALAKVQSSLDEVTDQIIQNMSKGITNNDVKIRDGKIVLNRELFNKNLSGLSAFEFGSYKYEFNLFLVGSVLAKEESKKIAQARLDRRIMDFSDELRVLLEETIQKAVKRKQNYTNIIAEIKAREEQDLVEIDHRIQSRYDDCKRVLMSAKLDFYHYHNLEAWIYNPDYDRLIDSVHQFVNDHVNSFAHDIINAFKEEYELDSDLGGWQWLFIESIRKVIPDTVRSIPVNIRMENLNYDELIRFERQQIDNMISDELFFFLLKLHCSNIRLYKLQQKEKKMIRLIESLACYVEEANGLLNMYVESQSDA